MNIDKSVIKNAIDSAENKLRICFDILVYIKTGQNCEKGLLDFQPMLADTLFELMKLYKVVCGKEKSMIDIKETIDISDFTKNMKEIHLYKKVISMVIDIGKGLGDTFAWIFFSGNLEELDKHLSHESTGLFPAGIGGYGEVEFIKNNQKLYGCLTIYHGITSMLRIGDFSLYAISTGIVATGELKSKIIDDKVSINAYLSSKYNLGNDFICKNDASWKEKLNEDVRTKDKLIKQLSLMDNLFANKNPTREINVFNDNNFELFTPIDNESMQYKVSKDNTLLACLLSINHERLSDILLSNDNYEFSESDSIKSYADKLFIPSSKHNQFIMGNVDNTMILGRIPMLWWPDSDIEIVKQIIFMKLLITTIFNPAKLYDYYEKKGFSIITSGDYKNVKFEKIINNNAVSICGISMYINMIMHEFLSVDSIIKIIDNVINDVEMGTFISNTKIKMITHLHI